MKKPHLPRLGRAGKIIRNLLLCLPLAALVWAGSGYPMPTTQLEFRRAEQRYLLPPAQESGVPAGLSRPQLLAALVEEGALRPGQIDIGTPQRGEAAGILNFLETGRPGA